MSDYKNNLPALRDPSLTPHKAVASLPQISGEAYSHVGKYAGAVVLACFEQMGGLASFVDWAEQNRTDYYTKIFGKTIQRSAAVDVSGTVTIDDAISRLEGQAAPGHYSDVTEAFFEDVPVPTQYDL